MAEYSRPASGFRFKYHGVKTNAIADALPEFKYPYAQNIRSYLDDSIIPRPQIAQQIAAPIGGLGGPVLSLEPTNGVYKIGSQLFVNGTSIDTGYAPGIPCSILPFRPNASPNAYDYVFDSSKATKVIVPSSGSPVVQKTGIAEPQNAPNAAGTVMGLIDFTALAANWTNVAPAGAPSDQTRSTDTVGVVFQDPGFSGPGNSQRVIAQVGSAVQYQVGESVTVNHSGGGNIKLMVEDVLPPLSAGAGITIKSIFYFAGNTGHCIIVPSQIGSSVTLPQTSSSTTPEAQSVFIEDFLATVRRGALLNLSVGNEIVMVLSVTRGPDGTVSIETSTVNNHIAGETITGIPSIVLSSTVVLNDIAGQPITSASIQSAISGAGTATLTRVSTFGGGVFGSASLNGSSPQLNDYLHISLQVSDLTQVTEIRFLFDVGDGTFTQNFYLFAIRPSDLTPLVAATQTQLGTAQIIEQRRTLALSEEPDPELGIRTPTDVFAAPVDPHFPITNVGDQSASGASQWSEIIFPINALTRVGNDQSKTLANCGAIRIQIVATGAFTLQFSSVSLFGGGQLDTGSGLGLYLYRVRPRNSINGAIGNPSPSTRYGVAVRRQGIVVQLPSAAYDSQIDTWDVFRFGGLVPAWKFIGSTTSSNASFTDNTFDGSIVNNDILLFDRFEPFPSIGPPISSTVSTIQGTVAQITFPKASQNPQAAATLAQLGNLLPGNEVLIGLSSFTLRLRPTLLSTTATTQTYLFTFEENAGSQTNPFILIQEPALAAQQTNAVFGPDVEGSFFAINAGGLRPGLIQWTNTNDPDSASDANTKDICPTSEPLQNGMIVDGLPVIFSPVRAWRGISGQGQDGRLTYNWREIPIGRGLAAQFGIVSDGQRGYIVARDGIYSVIGGKGGAITDDDLYNLFPHEAVFPQDITYAGQTIFAPDYTYVQNFHLGIVNGFLFFDYLDKTKTYRTLVYNIKDDCWSVDVYASPVTIHSAITKQVSNNAAPSSATRNQIMFTGDVNGVIGVEVSNTVQGNGEQVSCVVVTREEMLGDIRANKMFGDGMIDLFAPLNAVSITPIFLGSLFGTTTTISGGMVQRPSSPPAINLNGQQLQRSMGLKIAWTEQGGATQLNSWQPSYYTQPEDIQNRFTDWQDGGFQGNKFFQGFQIELDTINDFKSLIVRDNDTQATHSFNSDILTMALNQIQTNGQKIVTCSFTVPFQAHLVRLEPTDAKTWRLFGIKWIFEPAPEAALTWATQPTSFGKDGYLHAKEQLVAYASLSTVALTVTAFDGLSPAVIILPNTNGAYQKLRVPFTPNKGLLYSFSGVSSKPWQAYFNDWEVKIKQWGSAGPYETAKLIGNEHGDRARI